VLVFFVFVDPTFDAPVQANQRRKDMPEEVRKQVYQALLAKSNNGKLGKKDTTVVAAQFGVHICAVQRLWKQGKIALANNIPVDLVVVRGVELVVRHLLLIWNYCVAFLSRKE